MSLNKTLNDSIVFLSAVLFTIGQLEFFVVAKITNVLHLLVFIFVLYGFLLEASKIKGVLAYLTLLMLVFSPLLFLSFNGQYIENVSRWSWFFLLGMLPIHARRFPSRYLNTVNYVLVFYFILGLIIIADASFYFIIGTTFLFDFEYYITPRFSGPFNDPNFLGLVYALVLIFTYGFECSRKYLLSIRFVCLVILALSGSVSVVVFLAISMLAYKFYSVKSPIFYLYFSLSISFFAVPVLFHYSEDVFQLFSMITNFLFDLPQDLVEIKYRSLLYRFEVVDQAISLIYTNPLGFGYRSLLDYLPRDTHNSFIGMVFEYGIFPMLSLSVAFLIANHSKCNTAITIFLVLMPLMLNIHYLPIYLCASVYMAAFNWLEQESRIIC